MTDKNKVKQFETHAKLYESELSLDNLDKLSGGVITPSNIGFK